MDEIQQVLHYYGCGVTIELPNHSSLTLKYNVLEFGGIANPQSVRVGGMSGDVCSIRSDAISYRHGQPRAGKPTHQDIAGHQFFPDGFMSVNDRHYLATG